MKIDLEDDEAQKQIVHSLCKMILKCLKNREKGVVIVQHDPELMLFVSSAAQELKCLLSAGVGEFIDTLLFMSVNEKANSNALIEVIRHDDIQNYMVAGIIPEHIVNALIEYFPVADLEK